MKHKTPEVFKRVKNFVCPFLKKKYIHIYTNWLKKVPGVPRLIFDGRRPSVSLTGSLD